MIQGFGYIDHLQNNQTVENKLNPEKKYWHIFC